MESEFSLELDWGAKGSPMTGQQVQDLIKAHLNELHSQCDNFSSQLENLSDYVTHTELSAALGDIETALNGILA